MAKKPSQGGQDPGKVTIKVIFSQDSVTHSWTVKVDPERAYANFDDIIHWERAGNGELEYHVNFHDDAIGTPVSWKERDSAKGEIPNNRVTHKPHPNEIKIFPYRVNVKTTAGSIAVDPDIQVPKPIKDGK